MFIISLTYKAPLEEIDAHLEGHVAWLKECYERGLFIASGRKVPRDGGVILARGDRTVVEACLAGDPFNKNQLADYVITEFQPTMTADGFEGLAEA